MVAGHFGFAAGVKAKERQVPLWALMLATVWLDIVFAPLLILGIERLEPVPGTKGGYGSSIIHADYTHSLVGALVLGLVFGLVAAIPWGRRVGAVLAGVVFSHWVLDLIVHRGDMPILPANLGGLPRLGFGLWRFPLVSALLELAIVLVGCLLYWRSALQAAEAGDASPGRAHLVGGLALAAGVLVLVLDAVLAV